MANVTDDGCFVIKTSGGQNRFRFAMSNETLFIQVNGKTPKFTFLADRTEAVELRDWLNQNLEE